MCHDGDEVARRGGGSGVDAGDDATDGNATDGNTDDDDTDGDTDYDDTDGTIGATGRQAG